MYRQLFTSKMVSALDTRKTMAKAMTPILKEISLEIFVEVKSVKLG